MPFSIHADGEVVGAINVGYGTPPNNEAQLREIAEKYAVPYESLVKNAKEYLHRPAYLVELAKKRLQSAASLIGSLVERHKTQEKLRESEERFRNLHQSMVQPMAMHEIICDTAGTPVDYRFLSVNSAFEQLLDKKADEIVGHT